MSTKQKIVINNYNAFVDVTDKMTYFNVIGEYYAVPGMTAIKKTNALQSHYSDDEIQEMYDYLNMHSLKDGETTTIDGVEYIVKYNGNYMDLAVLLVNDVKFYEEAKEDWLQENKDEHEYKIRCQTLAFNQAIDFVKSHN